MADRTWITVFFPTPLIFRYHLPLRNVDDKKDILGFKQIIDLLI